MNYRKINSHIILLAIVIVVGLLVAMVARLMVLGQGVDAGTANLTFVIVLGVCAVVYLIIMSVFSHTIIPLVIRKLPETKRPAVETEAVPSIDNMPVMNVEQIKQDADRQFAERRKEKIELFLLNSSISFLCSANHSDSSIRSRSASPSRQPEKIKQLKI